MPLKERVAAEQEFLAKQAEAMKLEAEKSKIKADGERASAVMAANSVKEGLITKFSPYLEMVKAREQLGELRDLWVLGQVDSKPSLLNLGAYNYIFSPAVVLGLRFTYEDSARVMVCSGENSESQSGAIKRRNEFAVLIAVQEGPTIQSVATSRILATADGKKGWSRWEEYMPVRDFSELGPNHPDFGKNYILASVPHISDYRKGFINPQKFSIDDPAVGQKLLEDQLVKIAREIRRPSLDIIEAGKKEIEQDPFIPKRRWYYF